MTYAYTPEVYVVICGLGILFMSCGTVTNTSIFSCWRQQQKPSNWYILIKQGWDMVY